MKRSRAISGPRLPACLGAACAASGVSRGRVTCRPGWPAPRASRNSRWMSTLVFHDATHALTRELVPPLTAEQAVQEADRCLECGGSYAPAPCVVACPARVNVPGFVAAVAAGATDAAAATIFSENLLGGTCARVCPA